MQAPEKGMAAYVIKRIRDGVGMETTVADDMGDSGVLGAWGIDV